MAARRASDNKLERLQAFADMVAQLQTDDDLDGDMSGDDAVDTLAGVVRWARSLSDHHTPTIARIIRKPIVYEGFMSIGVVEGAPGETIEAVKIDGYPFTTGPKLAPCRRCDGGGEITEYPPDDDERMVACPACGGTGEAYE